MLASGTLGSVTGGTGGTASSPSRTLVETAEDMDRVEEEPSTERVASRTGWFMSGWNSASEFLGNYKRGIYWTAGIVATLGVGGYLLKDCDYISVFKKSPKPEQYITLEIGDVPYVLKCDEKDNGKKWDHDKDPKTDEVPIMVRDSTKPYKAAVRAIYPNGDLSEHESIETAFVLEEFFGDAGIDKLNEKRKSNGLKSVKSQDRTVIFRGTEGKGFEENYLRLIEDVGGLTEKPVLILINKKGLVTKRQKMDADWLSGGGLHAATTYLEVDDVSGERRWVVGLDDVKFMRYGDINPKVEDSYKETEIDFSKGGNMALYNGRLGSVRVDARTYVSGVSGLSDSEKSEEHGRLDLFFDVFEDVIDMQPTEDSKDALVEGVEGIVTQYKKLTTQQERFSDLEERGKRVLQGLFDKNSPKLELFSGRLDLVDD